jgi:hypothetical protein
LSALALDLNAGALSGRDFAPPPHFAVDDSQRAPVTS